MISNASVMGAQDGFRSYVRSVFDQYDDDNSNSIEPEEFRTLCTELGYYFEESELSTIFSIIDTDHSGTIEFEEFWVFWQTSERFKITDTRQLQLYRAAIARFREYDLDGNGQISFDEYKQIATRQGWNKTDDEIREIIAAIDTDGDGEISFDEFVAWLNWGL